MANQVVKLKKGSDYLYPYADFVGIDTSNVIASGSGSSSAYQTPTTYTATEDCFGYLVHSDLTTCKLGGQEIMRGITNTFPIKKGQVLTIQNGRQYGGSGYEYYYTIYGLKRTA